MAVDKSPIKSHEKWLQFRIPAQRKPLPDKCFSCGKPLIFKDKCHHCGASMLTRLSEFTLVIICVIIMASGGFLLYVASVASDMPVMEIGDLNDNHNFQTLRFKGTVVSVPNYNEEKYTGEGWTIGFDLNDTTGTLYVQLKQAVILDFLAEGKTVGLGDKVDVVGLVLPGPWMQVKKATHFKVEERQYNQMDLGDIAGKGHDELEEFSLVEITGRVTSVKTFYFAFSFYLEDHVGHSVNVFIPNDILDMTGDGLPPTSVYDGVYVTVKGGLLWYENYEYWEVIPLGVGFIESNATAANVDYQYEVLTVDSLLRDPTSHEYTLVRVENASIYYRQANYLFQITDETSVGNITIYREFGGNSPDDFELDDRVNVQGVFMWYDYGGYWEIKIREDTDDMMEVIS